MTLFSYRSQTKIITTMLDYFDEMGLCVFQRHQPILIVFIDLQRAD
ncbi:MAG: hypothetical protein ACLUI3_08950 [Christensenellales bacterium]